MGSKAPKDMERPVGALTPGSITYTVVRFSAVLLLASLCPLVSIVTASNAAATESGQFR